MDLQEARSLLAYLSTNSHTMYVCAFSRVLSWWISALSLPILTRWISVLSLTFFPGESLRFLLISHDGYLRFLLLSFPTNIWAFSHEGYLRFIPLSYILDLNIFSPHECYRFLLCICRRFIISQMRHVANREAVSEWFQLLVKLTPLPSHLLPPPPLPNPVWLYPLGRTHTPISHPPTWCAGEGH